MFSDFFFGKSNSTTLYLQSTSLQATVVLFKILLHAFLITFDKFMQLTVCLDRKFKHKEVRQGFRAIAVLSEDL